MPLTANQFVGNSNVAGVDASIHGINPATGESLQPAYTIATDEQIETACQLAQTAFAGFRKTSLEDRAVFLETIAANIMALGDELVERACAETGLPEMRIQGERGRTCGQLQLFANVVRAGNFQGARIDTAMPERAPLPRADLRLRYLPLGPVAVFGASNFPLAFSVAGGDTASAFAAGCPVVVKAHSAHPGTSDLVAQAIQKAVVDCNMPEGTFSMLYGSGNHLGAALVAHPVIKAVGFTGSRAGGLALLNIANNRPEPIPVYAEMASINPVVLMPAALSEKAEALAEGFVGSLTMGAGQFCTNPGLVLAIESEGLDTFVKTASAKIAEQAGITMLTPGIHNAYASGVSQLKAATGVELCAEAPEQSQPNQCRAALFSANASDFLADPETLGAEVFGASSMVVRCKDEAELIRLVEHMEGQLTATIHSTDADDVASLQSLVEALELRAGRVLFNGFPTGVEVCHAMVHGGPFPSTSNAATTSVGSAAIDRFLRPVCYQDVPAAVLPEAIQDANPQGLMRLVNGELTTDAL